MIKPREWIDNDIRKDHARIVERLSDQNESRTGLKPNYARVTVEMETGDSVWKDRGAAFIKTLAQIDDIFWAGIAKQTGSQDALDLARLGPDGRRRKFESVTAKARDDQK